MPAKSLIEKSKAKGDGSKRLPAKAVAEVKLVLAHNDGVPWGQKVSRRDVVKMLADDFGVNMSVDTLSIWCQRVLGRKFG